jgi:predicted aldo/keto reductase-like oxidoreductase
VRYRQFGRLKHKVSALGFGCMRLPKTEAGAIDEPEATRMVHHAIENGVNYFDTGYGYHNGESERFLGRALKEGGYRDRVWVATKLPLWAVKDASDFERLLTEQLQKLQTDHVDVYLLHGVGRKRWDAVRSLGVLGWLEKIRADGRARAIGFSFHDEFDVFKEIVDAYPRWDMCQILYNYMSEDFQAGSKGLEYAAARGMAVVVMEPLLGGRLASAPAKVQSLWSTAPRQLSPAEWALKWLWHKPEVSVTLSGMSTMQQVEENISSAGRSAVGGLSAAELELIGKVRDQYEVLRAVPCSSCAYCMPCPNGVDIPRSFSILNSGLMYTGLDDARQRYIKINRDQTNAILASSCVQCQDCEQNCPQHIPISEWMPYLHSVLGEGAPYDAKAAPKM